jgi:hypothetical protein
VEKVMAVAGYTVRRSSNPKRLTLYIDNRVVIIEHVDVELGRPRKIHKFDDGLIVITFIRKEAKSMVRLQNCVSHHLELISKLSVTNRFSALEVRSTWSTKRQYRFEYRFRLASLRKISGFVKHAPNDRAQFSFIGDDIVEESLAVGLPVDLLQGFEDTGNQAGDYIFSNNSQHRT